MKLYEFIPQKAHRKLSLISSLLLIGAVTVMLCTTILGDISYKWIFQLVSLIMLTAAIFIISRYVMKSYVYRIEATDNSSPDLTVTEIQNRHVVTVCRLAVSSIEKITVIPSDDKATLNSTKADIRQMHRKFYNYCPDFMPQKKLCLFATECGEPLAVFLTYDSELERILNDQI